MAKEDVENTEIETEETPELDKLDAEGAALEDTNDEGGEDEGGDEGAGEGDESVSELAARLDAFQDRLTEKDTEITYLRGELKRATTQQTTTKKDDEPLFDMDELVAQLTNKDPKVAAKAVVELAEKIADRKITAERERTTTLVRDSDSVRSAKEQDRANVLEEFTEDLEDPAFVDALKATFARSQAGGRYVPDSLYQAASTVRVVRARAAAAKDGGKKGVKEVRPIRQSANTTGSGGDDYSKVNTISSIPDNLMSPREKNIARATAKKMGVPEKEWVKNFMDEVKNGRAA